MNKRNISECDHDWEFCDDVKICTYENCQLEKRLTEEEKAWATIEADVGSDLG